MQLLEVLLHWEGYGLCHQLPARSFFGGGVQLPVCARDTGIYLGILISIALISAMQRGERPRRFPTKAGWAVIGLMIFSMALDGGTEYAGLRTTTNELRLITGLLAGFAVGALILPMLNDELWRSSSANRVLSTPWRLAIWIAAVPASYGVVYWVLPLLGVVYPALMGIVILATIATVNLVIVAMLPFFEHKYDRLVQAWPAILVAVVIALAEIALSAGIRIGLNGLIATLAR